MINIEKSITKFIPMIDKVKFKEMFAYYDKEVVAEVIDDFISEYEAKLNQIRDSIEDRNFELIRQSSHSFKGVVGTFMDPVPAQALRRTREPCKNE